MSLYWQILIAAALDLILGDPRWLPHPIRLIGRLVNGSETLTRRVFQNPSIAGGAAVFIVLSLCGSTVYVALKVAFFIDPLLRDAASIYIMYTCFSARDLAKHAMAALEPLEKGNLLEARRMAGMMVGRDTDSLDEEGVARAVTESVAENTADGVIAPLFYAAVAGPLGSAIYKAVNTMDSVYGYKNEKYLRFGWIAAKLDDVFNFIPARLTGLLTPLSAIITGHSAAGAIKIMMRDGRKSHSPNAGVVESAYAGALGVRLGGTNYYGGQPREAPQIGDVIEPLDKRHIRSVAHMMYGNFFWFLAILAAIHWIAGTLF